MSLVTMRPTFRLHLEANLSSVRKKIVNVLRRPVWKTGCQWFGDYAEFHVAESEVRYWSPHLAIHLEPLDSQHQMVQRFANGQLPPDRAPASLDAPADSDEAGSQEADSQEDGDSVENTGETLLLARFAPRQNVWMLVWIIYLAMAFVLFFAAVYASVQVWMNEAPWAVVFGALALAVIVALHFISKIGQGWSSDQMLELRQRLDDLLAEANIEVKVTTE